MDLFHGARMVSLRSHLDKFLMAENDMENVCQDRRGDSYNARWRVELVDGSHSLLRLKSCYGRYLTASNETFFLGVGGRKVLQTAAIRLDSSVEWEPIREGFQVKLKTHDGRFLRANGCLPPWRNSVTHCTPHCSIPPTWLLWDVHITLPSHSTSPSVASDTPLQPDRASLSSLPLSSLPSDVSLRLSNIENVRVMLPLPSTVSSVASDPLLQLDRAFLSSLSSDVSLRLSDIKNVRVTLPSPSTASSVSSDPLLQLDRASLSSLSSDVSLKRSDIENVHITLSSPSTASFIASDPPLQPDRASLSSSSSDVSEVSLRLSDTESRSSFSGPLHKVEGRTIHYTVLDDDGNLDESFEGSSFIFNELSIKELTQKLEVETNLSDIIVCYHNPVIGRLQPLGLPLPPRNAATHVVVVRASSRVARTFTDQLK